MCDTYYEAMDDIKSMIVRRNYKVIFAGVL